MTRLIIQVYTYTSVKDLIVQKFQKSYVYEMESSSRVRDLEAYDTEGERLTRIISLDTDTNNKETNQIIMYMLYQAEIPKYIKRSIEFKQNLHK